VELEGVVEQILHSEADLVKLLPRVVLYLCVPHQLIWDPGLIEPQNPLYGTFWGILNDICLGVGSSYVVSDFAVVESGGSENAPIILGRPFLTTFKAFIYTETAKIVFTISLHHQREDGEIQFQEQDPKSSCTPKYPYPQEYKPAVEKKRRNRRNKKNDQPRLHVEEVWMINTI
jgi:hypothetical protein